MDDIKQRLRMSPQEERVSDGVGLALLGGLLLTLGVLFGPSLAYVLLGMTPVLAGLSVMGVLGLAAVLWQVDTVRTILSMPFKATYYLLFHKVWSMLFIPSEEEDESPSIVPEGEEEAAMAALEADLGETPSQVEEPEDPLEAIEDMLRDLKAELEEHERHLQNVQDIVDDAQAAEDAFTAEASRQEAIALEKHEAQDERGAGLAFAIMKQKQQSAARAAEERETAASLLEVLTVLADQTSLTIIQTEDEIRIQSLRARTHEVSSEALPGDFESSEDAIRRNAAMQALHRSVAVRAGRIEAQTHAARQLVSQLRIRGIAESRRQIAALRGDLEASSPEPATPVATPVSSPVVPAGPPSSGVTDDSPKNSRAEAMRRALAKSRSSQKPR